jgi:hypothetical protein
MVPGPHLSSRASYSEVRSTRSNSYLGWVEPRVASRRLKREFTQTPTAVIINRNYVRL